MDDDDDGLGFGFFLRIAGVIVAAGIIGLILILIFSRAVVAWSFFGAFIALAVVLLVIAWFYDRRQERRYGSEEL